MIVGALLPQYYTNKNNKKQTKNVGQKKNYTKIELPKEEQILLNAHKRSDIVPFVVRGVFLYSTAMSHLITLLSSATSISPQTWCNTEGSMH